MAILCPSCGATHTQDLGPIAPGYTFAGRLLDTLLPGGRLYRCPNCELFFRHPMPPKGKLNALYQAAPATHWQYGPSERTDWRVARRWLAGRYKGGCVLDVGCYDGAFLSHLEAGWTCYGIELNEAARNRASQQGVQVVASDLEALGSVTKTFDVVCAFDVMEHVRDPDALLRSLAEHTRSGGAIIFGTGNTDALSWRLMQSRYWYCTIPEHLAFVGERWTRRAARRHDLHLEHLERFSHSSTSSLRLRAYETGLNVLYRLSPSLFGWLRAQGFGEVDVASHPGLRLYPPLWTTAADHFIAILTKR